MLVCVVWAWMRVGVECGVWVGFGPLRFRMYPPPHTTRMLCVECGWALVRCAYGFRS
jgi:hypothetical protein